MKRTTFLLSLSTLLLIGCGNNANPDVSSGEITSSEETISETSSEESSSSNEEESSHYYDPEAISKRQAITKWLKEFAIYEGSVNHIQFSGSNTITYCDVQGESSIEVSSSSSGVTDRYAYSSVGAIRVEQGTTTFGDGEPDTYEKQTFHDQHFYYALTSYGSGEKSYENTGFEYGKENHFLSLSFYQKQLDTLNELKSLIGGEDVHTELHLPEIQGDGTYELSYSYALYNAEYRDHTIDYSISFTIQDGYVSESVQTMNNTRYLLNVPTNILASSMTTTYSQGELGTFEGTVFNPKDFIVK